MCHIPVTELAVTQRLIIQIKLLSMILTRSFATVESTARAILVPTESSYATSY